MGEWSGGCLVQLGVWPAWVIGQAGGWSDGWMVRRVTGQAGDWSRG